MMFRIGQMRAIVEVIRKTAIQIVSQAMEVTA
jgi:hypothetical protein